MLNKIAVLTSGGDAPGMNAAVRAVVRTALHHGIEAYGVNNGYYGLYHNDIHLLNRQSVAEIINRGGTFLGSARFPEFKDLSTRETAIKNLEALGIQALVVIGGDGSYQGASALSAMGLHCIGIPGTIDNDVPGTEYTIGFYTALNTAISAIDNLRDTSSSHKRASVVEIMGRHCGDLTIAAAIGCGAELAIVPEVPMEEEDLMDRLKQQIIKGKKHALICVTERVYDVNKLARQIQDVTGVETRATILGHIQRGGAPSAFDRILASRMGAYAVELLMEGKSSHCIGIQANKLVHHEIQDALQNEQHQFDTTMLDLCNKLR